MAADVAEISTRMTQDALLHTCCACTTLVRPRTAEHACAHLAGTGQRVTLQAACYGIGGHTVLVWRLQVSAGPKTHLRMADGTHFFHWPLPRTVSLERFAVTSPIRSRCRTACSELTLSIFACATLRAKRRDGVWTMGYVISHGGTCEPVGLG